jgi:hypothetical protein
VTPATDKVKAASPQSVPDLPLLPVSDATEIVKVPAPPPLPKTVAPEIMPPVAPLAAKPEPKKLPDMFVVEKDSDKLFAKLESTEDKSHKLVVEQIDKMKKLFSYNEKTQ